MTFSEARRVHNEKNTTVELLINPWVTLTPTTGVHHFAMHFG